MEETEESQARSGAGSDPASPAASGSAAAAASASAAATSNQTNQTYNFDFYMRFTKPLIVNLPDPNEKTLASAWIQKLKEDSGSEDLRTEYLKLLLFVLHRRKLGGPFLHHPGDEPLELPEGTKIVDLARDILRTEHEEKVKKMQNKTGAGDFPPYSVEVSGDMLQYVASQEIPRFGSHVFYAISSDPIHSWDNLDVGVLPKETLAESVKSVNANASNLSLKSARSKPLMQAEKDAARSPRSKTPLMQPFSPLARVDMCPDPRRPITWGSNLIQVTDPPDPEESDETDEPDDDEGAEDDYRGGMQAEVPQRSPLQFGTPIRSPMGNRAQSPMFSTSMTPIKSPRSSSRSPGRGEVSFQDLMNTSMPDAFEDSFGRSAASSPSRSPRSGGVLFDDLMNTSMPGEFEDSFQESPRRSPPRGQQTPKASPLPQVRHIRMSSRDQEARDIIEEANRLLMDQELRVKEGTPKGRPGDRMSPIKSPTPTRMTPARAAGSSPRPASRRSPTPRSAMSTPRRQTPSPRGSPRAARAGSPQRGRLMSDLFPDIAGGETDDDFLFDVQPDLDEVDLFDESMDDDLEQQIRQIQDEYAIESDTLPVGAGLAVTTPSIVTTPTRRREYGDEYPLLEEDIPDLFELSFSPDSRRRFQQEQHGLIPLVSEQRSPRSPQKPQSPGMDQTLRTPKQQKTPSPSREKTPSPKRSARRQSPARRTQEEVEEEADAQYVALYNTLISPEGPKRTPKKQEPCSNLPPSMASPKAFSLGWVTPPHLKVQRETQRPASPSFTYHLGPPRDDDFLANETYPDLLLPDTPPRGPEPMTYEDYVDPFKDDEDDESDDVAELLDEEEPLCAKLEAHEWHPYKPRQFSIKVGARAKNVILPRKSAPPSVPPISEEAEFYQLNSPTRSPAQPVNIDYGASYMLPSSARTRQADQRHKTPPKSPRSPKSPKTPQRAPQPPSTEAPSILADIQEHFDAKIEDPRQHALLEHVAQIVQTVEQEEQASQERQTTPCRQEEEEDDWLMDGSPPAGFQDLDMMDEESPLRASPTRSPRSPRRLRSTPRRQMTPELNLASPPQGFEDIDAIDAEPEPLTPIRYPGQRKRQSRSPRRTPTFDFGGPVEEFMPEYGALDFGDADDMGILDESFPDDMGGDMFHSPRIVTEIIDATQTDATSQTVSHTQRVNETWPPARRGRSSRANRSLGTNTRARPDQTTETVTETEMTERGPDGGKPKTSRKQVVRHINYEEFEPVQEQGPPQMQETIIEQIEVQTPNQQAAADGQPSPRPSSTTRQVRKKINYEHSGIGTQTPRTPPPDDMMGYEGNVDYTPRQYNLLDTSITDEHLLQQPMKLPIVIPGWSTPEHLKTPQSPQLSPPNMPWIVPVRYPGALDEETMPEYYEEPYSPPRAGPSAPCGPSPSPVKTPVHKKCVTKIQRTPEGTTTTTTIETLEETSPPQYADYDDSYSSPAPNMQQQGAPQMQFGPQSPQFPGPSSPRGQQMPSPPQFDQAYSPGAMWNLPADTCQLADATPPDMFDADQSWGSDDANQSVYADLVYNPPSPGTPGPFAHLTSPSQYKTPEFKKTTYIHEECPLYDRVEQIVEDVSYESDENQMASDTPPTMYRLTSPPRPDYFDIIDVGNRAGIESEEYMGDLYATPPRQMMSPEQSPHTPQLLQRPDWDLWPTPPSGMECNPYALPEMPQPMGDYEPMDLEGTEEYPDLLGQSPYMSDESQDISDDMGMSAAAAFEHAGMQYDMDPQAYENEYPPAHELHTTTTRTTTVTEEVFYDETPEAPEVGYDLEWDSPPRQERRDEEPYQRYQPPSMYGPPQMTPPQYFDNPYEPGLEQEEFVYYNTSEQDMSDSSCYDGIEQESPEFYDSM